jgi:23S rRNA pseudouridine1911/1915/1917 synthase
MTEDDTTDIPFLEAEEVEESLFDHYRIVADRGQQLMRADLFLATRVPNASRTKIQAGMEAGFVRVNNQPLKPSYKVKPGDVFVLSLPEPPRTDEILGEDIPLDIVYEDEHLLIVNKPAGMVVHPAYGNWTGTLVNALIFHFGKNLAQSSAAVRPGLVHRIDKDTSGLLVVAKSDLAMMKLSRQFFEHTIERKYRAIVWGVPTQEAGTINVNLGRSLKDRKLVEAKPDGGEGTRHAITHYRVLERFAYASLIECKLETGRTHQIRAHMKYLGHTLFADTAYGGDKILKGPQTGAYKHFVQSCLALCGRQALHAATLGFEHPATGKHLFFEAPLPPDFAGLLEKWQGFK